MYRSLLQPSSGCHTTTKNNIQTITKTVKLKSSDVTVNILGVPCCHKISDYVTVKNRDID